MDMDVGGAAKLFELIRWPGLITAVFLVAGAWLLLRFLDATTRRLSDRFAEWRLTFQKVQAVLRFAIYIAAALAVVGVCFKLDQNLITIMGGTMIVTVGFALKDLAAAVLAGITILMDRPFQVGDRVTFGGQYGEITAIGLRSVRMRTLDDNIVTIPNNSLMTEIAASGNYGALEMQIVCDFYVGCDQDVERAQQLVEEAVVSSRYVYLARPVVVVMSQLIHQNHFAVRLRARAYVCDVKYEEDYVTDVNRRVLRAFREHGVLAPAILVRPGAAAEALSSRTEGDGPLRATLAS